MIRDYNVEEKRRKEEEGKEERGKKIPKDLSKYYIAFFFILQFPFRIPKVTSRTYLLYSFWGSVCILMKVSMSLTRLSILPSKANDAMFTLSFNDTDIRIKDTIRRQNLYFQKLL